MLIMDTYGNGVCLYTKGDVEEQMSELIVRSKVVFNSNGSTFVFQVST